MPFIIKHPDAWTLYRVVDDPATLPIWQPKPDGVELLDDATLADWVATEKANGWVSAPVTPLQMRRALNQTGLRASVEAAIAVSNQDEKDAWDYALEIRRDNPMLVGMATQLGMTEKQLDDLFALAATFN